MFETALSPTYTHYLKFKSIGDPELTTWLSTRRYMSHEIQNEIFSIMVNHLLRQLVKDISPNFLSLLCDEYTDIVNKEQLTFCLRWVNDDLQAFEDFWGFYGVPNISANTIVSSIKDACVSLALPLDKCRGQSYNGASNMLGKHSGVAKQICDIQPRAHPTHCRAHSLNLSVKDMTTNSKLMEDALDIAGKIVILIKYSPIREGILGDIKGIWQYIFILAYRQEPLK